MSVCVVVPAYNLAHVIGKTLDNIREQSPDSIIVVDDCSSDGTSEAARADDVTLIRHEQNRGYGGAQKTGFRAAIESGAGVVVLVHGDNQYDPRYIPQFVQSVESGHAAVTGTRMAGDPRDSGMPTWRFLGNRAFTWLQNKAFGTRISDFHNGYRAYAGDFLRDVDLDALSDAFDFDVQILVEALRRNRTIGEVPHETRYHEENSSIGLLDTMRCGWAIVRHMTLYRLRG